MDFSEISIEKINMSHFKWLGFKEQNGAFVKEGFDGEIQYLDGEFLYVKDGKTVKRIDTNFELHDIFLASAYNGSTFVSTNNSKTPIPNILFGLDFCVGTQEGDICNREGCHGVIKLEELSGCTCFVNAPCTACINRGLVCDNCRWESNED